MPHRGWLTLNERRVTFRSPSLGRDKKACIRKVERGQAIKIPIPQSDLSLSVWVTVAKFSLERQTRKRRVTHCEEFHNDCDECDCRVGNVTELLKPRQCHTCSLKGEQVLHAVLAAVNNSSFFKSGGVWQGTRFCNVWYSNVGDHSVLRIVVINPNKI